MGHASALTIASPQAAAAPVRGLSTRTLSPAPCGNQAMLRRLQTKLKVGAVNDPLEHEADRVADQVMRMADPGAAMTSAPPQVSRKCAACEEQVSRKRPACEAEEKLQKKGVGSQAGPADAPASVHEALRSPGQPLDAATRAYFEPRFGRDFSDVRVHSDPRASHAADAVQAQAFTFGSDIVFGGAKFSPSTFAGRKLVAHELTHVVQQGAAPAATTSSPAQIEDFRTPRTPDPWLQRQPDASKSSRKTEACPPMEGHEREDADKAQLRLVERIPQQEWLISGFPIGGSEISRAQAEGFISAIVRSLMQGHFVYMTGQDPLEVLGFSDCFGGQLWDNDVLRRLRAAKFCAAVKDVYAPTPKTYPALIRSCEAAPKDEYVGSNATPADRAQNRSVLVRRIAVAKAQFQEENQSFPYDPKYGPSEAHCAAYTAGRNILGPVYSSNAHCSCLVTPDEPHNNCVRSCLQDKMWTMLANASRDRKPNDPPMDINTACPMIWKHHRDCYHDCGCASEFIDYLAFDAVCNIPLPCTIDSAAINVLNRCMPATENDKYIPRH